MGLRNNNNELVGDDELFNGLLDGVGMKWIPVKLQNIAPINRKLEGGPRVKIKGR